VGPLSDAAITVVTSFLGALLVLYPLWLGVGQYLLDRIEDIPSGESTRRPLERYDANALFLSYLVVFFLIDTTVVVLGSVVPAPVGVSMRLLIGVIVVIHSFSARDHATGVRWWIESSGRLR
jgi:hypothetical protein